MKFFVLSGEIKHLAGAKVADYFEKAVKSNHHITAHREFVRDILKIFADKTELTFAQACQVTRGGTFAPYAQNMHRKRIESVPKTILRGTEKITNPLYERLVNLSDLPSEGHAAFMRDGWNWATSLIHPHSKPTHRGSSEMSRSQEQKIARQIFRHMDETREAHLKRTAEALARFLNDPQVLQKASDTLLERVSMSMRL